MSDSPRRSSIRSTRFLPSTLRFASTSHRSTSNPHLSLVFAQPGSTSSSALDAESALSKQLDGDLGGRQMGLRSRRGSSATIRTVRSQSGRGEGLTSPAEEAEAFAAASVAGPSRRGSEADSLPAEIAPPATSIPLPPRGPSPSPSQRLNPKHSSSWLRWNSPAPQFPRSASKDKGKGKARETPLRDEIPFVPADLPEAAPTLSTSPSQVEHMPPPSPEPTSAPPVAPKPNPRRGWFTPRDPPPNIEPAAPFRDEAIQAEEATPIPTTTLPADDQDKLSTRAIRAPSPNPLVANASAPPTSDTDVPSDSFTPSAPISSEPDKSGWGRWLWGTRGGPTALGPVARPSMSAAETRPIEQDGAERARSPWPSEDPPPAPSPATDNGEHALKSPPSDPEAPRKPGWGTYLYSYVGPPRAPPITDSTKTDGETADVPPSASPVDSAAPTIPAPLQPTLSASPASHLDSRRQSTSSQTGWLNYLAFRAATRKLPPASNASGEEVMDFSSDPNFPPANHVESNGAAETETPKPAAKNLTVHQKRLSNASQLSGSITPLSSSPKAPSSLTPKPPPSSPAAPNRLAKERSQSKDRDKDSALPPPPKPPSTQPNLVIPTFATTFDRPPRSLPPLAASTDAKPGLTGTAWRTLGTIGSYVYSPTPPATASVTPPDSRGAKEGRHVGADLPRRVGMFDGDPDSVWRGVRRVAVIGVHGWFPAKMLNSVIGEPTGTSVKFANMMGASVKRFFEDKGVPQEELRVTLMPLEGEGTIDSRVDRLYKSYLSNPAWINDLRRADAIFFAAHSQGCIVTTHLMSRLIAQGHIRTPLNAEAVARCEWAFGPVGVVPDMGGRGRRGKAAVPRGSDGGHQLVGMLAMCGVHLGPHPFISTSTVIQPYLQWFENAAARELFEFQDTTSVVSITYQRALSDILENGVRVLLLASLNDQVVPIYGSSFSTANHPLLLRALFVDGASYTASDFMTNLLCFAFMLRNAGIDDQRLVEHLSEATAGSLTGVGHSTPYEDSQSYNLLVHYLFHAGPPSQPLPPLQVDSFSTRETRNDFELPWIMRSLVDSPEIKDLFPGELQDLKEGVVAWRPMTKALREIKRRLEPMAGRQSKLRNLTSSPSSASLASTGHEPANKGLGVQGLRKDW